MAQSDRVSQRHSGIDFVKYLCAFMVICIHMTYAGKTYLEPLTRFAVPVFFMITGYFYSSVKQNGKEYKQLKKVLQLLISSSLLYLLWNIVRYAITGKSIPAYFHSILNIQAFINFVCFNESNLSGHLWYLSALVYVLVIVLLLDKYSSRDRFYKLIPLLLLINIITGTYSTILFGKKLSLLLSRNFLFCGLPFFLLGDAIYKTQIKLTRNSLLVIAILSVLVSTAENALFLHIGVAFNSDCFIATPFLATSVFMLALKSQSVSTIPILAKIARLGKTASTAIYIIHPIVILIMNKTVGVIANYVPWLHAVWHCTAPFVVLVVCTLLSCIFSTLQRNLRQIKQPTA